MIEDNIQEIGQGVASEAIRRRFFLVFQYEAQMKAKQNTVRSIIQRLNEEADTARRYLDLCELEVLEPRYSDDFMLKLLYEIINKKTSRRLQLPEGVFDMTTTVHGIYAVSYTHLSWRFAMKRLYRVYLLSMVFVLTITMMMPSSFAVDDMWTVANNLIVDLYSQIVKISTVLAGLMSAVAVIGAKLSNNQHKVDQAWDCLLYTSRCV